MRCPECGLENLPQLDRCARCGRGLERQLRRWSEVLPPRRADRSASTQASLERTRRGLRSGRAGLRWLWNLLWYQADTSREDLIAHRSPTLAGLLSLIPGLGHAYARRGLIGLGLFALFVAGIVTILSAVRSPVSNITAACLVVLQAVAASWAVAEVRRQNGDTAIAQRLVGAILLTFGLLSGIYTAGWVAMSRSFRPMTLTQNQWSAEFRGGTVGSRFVPIRLTMGQGDRILVDVRRPTLLGLKPGDVILFDSPGWGDVTVQRIVAGPGDTLTVDGSRITRNGRALRRGELPLLPSASPVRLLPFSRAIDEGQYAVLPYALVSPQHGLDIGAARAETYSFTTISRGDIIGRVVAVYNPPAHRRTF